MAPRQADEPPTTFQPIGDPRSDPPEPRDRSRVTAPRDAKLARPRDSDTPAMPPLYRSEPAPKRPEPARSSSRAPAREENRAPHVEETRAPHSGQRRDGRRPSDTGPPSSPPLLPAASSRPAPAPAAPVDDEPRSRTAFGPLHVAVAAAALLIGYFVGRARDQGPPEPVAAPSAPIAAPAPTTAAEVEVDDVDDVDVQVEVAPPPAPVRAAPVSEPAPPGKTAPEPRPSIAEPPLPKSPGPKPPTGDPYGDDPPPPKPKPKPPSDDPYGEP